MICSLLGLLANLNHLESVINHSVSYQTSHNYTNNEPKTDLYDYRKKRKKNDLLVLGRGTAV